MSAGLVWGIKASLLAYLGSLADGSAVVAGGASRTSSGGFRFPFVKSPSASAFHFRGSVSLSGHGGMMLITLADPWVDLSDAGATLSMVTTDDDGTANRVPMARMPAERTARRTWECAPVRLTSEGASALGALQYYESQRVDDLSFSAS